MREPDWEALAELQFLLYNRIADSLNAALSSIALSDMPEAQDRPASFWKERATAKVANVLNLFTAWSYLVRYKMGETIPEHVVRPFPVNALLRWLSAQLQIDPVPQAEVDLQLQANQESVQEALLLLHSAAQALGTGIRLETEVTRLGVWFHIRFSRPTPLPPTLDALLDSFKDHWRDQTTLFELATARDFIRLNGSDLMLGVGGALSDLMFFVRAAGVKRETLPPPSRALHDKLPTRTKPLDPSETMTPLAKPDAGVQLTPEDFGATPILTEAQAAQWDEKARLPDTSPLDAPKPTGEPKSLAPPPLLRRVADSPPDDADASKPTTGTDEEEPADAPPSSDSPASET